MNTAIRDISEMTDSREMLEAKASPVVSIFIYLLFFIITVALIWSYFGEMDEVVKATGVVRPNEKVSSIKSKVVGKVESIQYKAGQKVKQGDVLFTLEKDELELQKQVLTEELQKAEEELSLLKSFKQGIMDEKNYFSLDTENEEYYYNQFMKYQLDYLNLKIDLEKEKKDNTLSHTLYSQKLVETKENLKNVRLLEKSVLDYHNYFTEKNANSEFLNKYMEYELNLKQLQQTVDQKKEKYEVSKSLGENIIPRMEIEDEKKQYEMTLLDMEAYKNNYLLGIRSSIEELTKQKNELELNVQRTNQVIYSKQSDSENAEYMDKEKYVIMMLDKFKTDQIVLINDNIKNQKEKVKNLEEQIKNIEITIHDRVFTAPIDGVIQLVIEINQGDLVTSGTEIIKIIPETDSEYKVMLMVSNQDISEIKAGDQIKYHFFALPYKEYGEISGTVNKISADSTASSQDGNSYYLVEATIQNRPLYSYKGQEARVKVGMVNEAYIVTDSKKILYYLLEKIDLRD